MFTIDGTLLVVFFSFIVFMVLMNAIYFGPILKVKEARESAIELSKEASTEAQRKQTAMTEAYLLQLSEARRAAQHLIQEKREAAKKLAFEKIANARQDAHTRLEAQSTQLKQSVSDTYETLQSEQDTLVHALVAKLSQASTAVGA